jgi:glucosamine--fructose-6-phosphate aminotransferase (isomerizing)
VGAWTLAVVAQDLPEIESRAQHTVRVPVVRPELAALVSTVALHLFAYHFAIARDALGIGVAGSLPKS